MQGCKYKSDYGRTCTVYDGRCPNEKTFPHFTNSLLKAEGGTNSVNRKCNPLRRSCVSCARNAGESAICHMPAQPSAEIVRVECAKCTRECDLSRAAQPSAEIVRVECAKCRRECDLPHARATLCGDGACRVNEMQARVRLARSARNPLRRSCVSSARNAGESAICPCPRNPLQRSCVSSARNARESAICPVPAQPSAEIVRVECAKCRRECDLSHARATLCGEGACRVHEMQARVRLARSARNPLRRSCASSARNAGESAICHMPAQHSAEIARVECAKCRRACDLSGARATLCGDRACRVREMQARVRLVRSARNPLRRSCVSRARNAGESAICHMPAQPSAEIVRVECAKSRRECDVSTRTGDLVIQL